MSVQQSDTGYSEAIIKVLRNNEDDKLAAAKKDDPLCVLSSEPSYVIREVSTPRFSLSLLRRRAL